MPGVRVCATVASVLVAISVVVACVHVPLKDEPPVRLVVTEKPLGEVSSWSSLQVSPDGSHVAYLQYGTDGMSMVVDGKRGRSCDGMSSVVWSPASDRCACIALRGATEMVVCGERESRGYCRVSHLCFSANGARLAYLVHGDWMTSLPGERESFVVFDGVEGKAYSAVWDLVVSPNGENVAYCARIECGEGKTGDLEQSPAMKPAAAHNRGTRASSFVVVDGCEGKWYDSVRRPVFSGDGTRMAYVAKRGQSETLVVDGVESRWYDSIHYDATVFSPDSRRVAYGARRDGKCFLVLDNVEGAEFECTTKGISFAGPVFSPDSRRTAFAVMKNGKWMPVFDGVEGRSYGAVWGLMFSPDSARFAFRASRSVAHPMKPFVVVDGKSHRRYLEISQPVFSPDSAHLAYVGLRKGGMRTLVVDGVESRPFNHVAHAPAIMFDGPDSLSAIILRNRDLLRVSVSILD